MAMVPKRLKKSPSLKSFGSSSLRLPAQQRFYRLTVYEAPSRTSRFTDRAPARRRTARVYWPGGSESEFRRQGTDQSNKQPLSMAGWGSGSYRQLYKTLHWMGSPLYKYYLRNPHS